MGVRGCLIVDLIYTFPISTEAERLFTQLQKFLFASSIFSQGDLRGAAPSASASSPPAGRLSTLLTVPSAALVSSSHSQVFPSLPKLTPKYLILTVGGFECFLYTRKGPRKSHVRHGSGKHSLGNTVGNTEYFASLMLL